VEHYYGRGEPVSLVKLEVTATLEAVVAVAYLGGIEGSLLSLKLFDMMSDCLVDCSQERRFCEFSMFSIGL
jgi:hypothetical protein